MLLMVIHGKGAHGRVVASAAREHGYRVRFTDDAEGTRPSELDIAHIAIGDNKTRKEQSPRIIMSVIHPTAFIDGSVRMDAGVFVGPKAVIHVGATVGRGAIVNSGAIVEHDCRVGDWAHLSPGAVLCGNVTVGEGAWIGANAVVKEGVTIAPWSVIGCGAVVIRDIEKQGKYIGVPARAL